MTVVGIIIPVGYFHINQPIEETTIYTLPIRLAEPSLTFEVLPTPEELPSYFERIVEDVQTSFARGDIIPENTMDYYIMDSVHVSLVQMVFYAGLRPDAQPEVWHRMVHMTEGERLAHYRFDDKYAHDAAMSR